MFVKWKKVGWEAKSPEKAAEQVLRGLRYHGVLRNASNLASLFRLLFGQYPFYILPTMGRVYVPASQMLGLAMWFALAGRLADVMWEEVLNKLAQFGTSPALQWSAMKRAGTKLWAWVPEHTQMEHIYIQTEAWSPHINQAYLNPQRQIRVKPQTCKHGGGCYMALLRQELTAASDEAETWPRDSETTLEGKQPTRG